MEFNNIPQLGESISRSHHFTPNHIDVVTSNSFINEMVPR